MKNALKWLRIAKPFLRLAQEELADLDDNDTGTDDVAAAAIGYVVDVTDALTKRQPIPLPPAILIQGSNAPATPTLNS